MGCEAIVCSKVLIFDVNVEMYTGNDEAKKKGDMKN
jgi:hypothetical protein